MGSSSSSLTEDMLEEYTQLSYLSRAEILHLLKKFFEMAPEEMNSNLHYRFPVQQIKETFPEIKYNPFHDRIIRVFSSKGDGCMSFEDMLDLCSVMSENCPHLVKAKWAFQIFDFDEDGQVGKQDISTVVDRLTQDKQSENIIDDKGKNDIVSIILQGMDLQKNGSISELEFQHALSKMSEFPQTFCFRI